MFTVYKYQVNYSEDVILVWGI